LRKLKTSELNRLTKDQFKSSEKFPVIIVLDNIRSMHNVGSVFRTCDAFRIEALYLCGITAKPPHREIQRTALDATETVDWTYFENTIDAVLKLKSDGYSIYGIEQVDKSILLSDFFPENNIKIALILGNEIEGVSEEIIDKLDACIEIPQFGMKHSLNVSVSAGIVIWDIINKIKLF
jgi:tRNA G18 (ribose-2'-O)-methylase SpoU